MTKDQCFLIHACQRASSAILNTTKVFILVSHSTASKEYQEFFWLWSPNNLCKPSAAGRKQSIIRIRKVSAGQRTSETSREPAALIQCLEKRSSLQPKFPTAQTDARFYCPERCYAFFKHPTLKQKRDFPKGFAAGFSSQWI